MYEIRVYFQSAPTQVLHLDGFIEAELAAERESQKPGALSATMQDVEGMNDLRTWEDGGEVD